MEFMQQNDLINSVSYFSSYVRANIEELTQEQQFSCLSNAVTDIYLKMF